MDRTCEMLDRPREIVRSTLDWLSRLDRARELLHRTRLTIAEIAREVGFRDPAYFSRIFKACTDGSGPRQFRRSGQAPPAGAAMT